MMRRLLSIMIPAALVLSISAGASFAVNDRAGTTAMPLLKLGAGARPTALGDAYVAVNQDVNAVAFNPAGLSNMARPEFAALHTQWFQGISYNFAAFAYPTEKGTLGLSAATLSVDDIQRRSASEEAQGTLDALNASYGLTYAWDMGPFTSLGLTGHFLRQEIDSTSASSWSGDVGVIRRFAGAPLSLGLAARHMGPSMKFGGASDPLPTTIDGGASAAFWHERLTATGDVRFIRDSNVQYGLGLELRQPLGKDTGLAGRVGYNSAATGAGGPGLTVGGGFEFRLFTVDVAWVSFGDLGNTLRYSARLRF